MQYLLRYLKGTFDYNLSYCDYPAILEGYCDANWISDIVEVKPTSGYVFTLAGRAVSSKSSKQTCIVRSTMESELVALDRNGNRSSSSRVFTYPYLTSGSGPVARTQPVY